MKTNPSTIHHEMANIVDGVRRYFEARLRKEAVATLNESIRTLRIVLQQMLTEHFLSLPIPKTREFRFALGDRLSSVCNDVSSSNHCTPEDQVHHRYCVSEILACFEWAEQIKEEIPDDPITQKILVVDIPILRPFDYGLGKKGKPIRFRSK